jgi:cytidylate kinase
MGSVVFPDAEVKVFMTASAEERAQRRYKQLKEKGLDAKLSDLLDDIVARDERDMNRSISPLVAADDAVLIDTTEMSIDEVVGQVLGTCQERLSLTVKNGVSVSR